MQSGEHRFCNFSLLSPKTVFGKLADKYKAKLDAFETEFEKRFQEYTNLEQLFNILNSQFSSETDKAPEDIYS